MRGCHTGAARLVAAVALLLTLSDGAASAPNYCRVSADEVYPLFAGAIALPGAEPRLRRRETPFTFNAEEEAKSALLSEDTRLETALLDRMDRILRSANDYTGLSMVIDRERRGFLHVIVPSESKKGFRDLAGKSNLKFFVSEECYLFLPIHLDMVNEPLVGQMTLVTEKGFRPHRKRASTDFWWLLWECSAISNRWHMLDLRKRLICRRERDSSWRCSTMIAFGPIIAWKKFRSAMSSRTFFDAAAGHENYAPAKGWVGPRFVNFAKTSSPSRLASLAPQQPSCRRGRGVQS
jgi:hypothetical protein